MSSGHFVDTAEIHVKAGNGGRGSVSFRREKYIPKGGPDGGDGGDGGSVIFVADPNKNTLLDFAGRHHWHATNGGHGMGKKMYGKGGEDLYVPVPPGTEVYDLGLGLQGDGGEAEKEGLKIADLTEPGQRVVIAKGGRGGLGNWHFRSSTNQAPREAGPGEPGEERSLRLELKLIADVGLAGLPNAGKSTLLAAVSAARPRVADYPFTTLEPNLGIAEIDEDRRLVIADIPGLIEGASEGAGLGHAFLRHIERCKVLVHLVSVFPLDGSDTVENYHTIRRELESFSPLLASKRQVIAANKIDLLVESDEPLQRLREALPGEEIIPISGATGQNVRELLEACWRAVRTQDESGAGVSEGQGVGKGFES
jgi:GTP-binding protein